LTTSGEGGHHQRGQIGDSHSNPARNQLGNSGCHVSVPPPPIWGRQPAGRVGGRHHRCLAGVSALPSKHNPPLAASPVRAGRHREAPVDNLRFRAKLAAEGVAGSGGTEWATSICMIVSSLLEASVMLRGAAAALLSTNGFIIAGQRFRARPETRTSPVLVRWANEHVLADAHVRRQVARISASRAVLSSIEGSDRVFQLAVSDLEEGAWSRFNCRL